MYVPSLIDSRVRSNNRPQQQQTSTQVSHAAAAAAARSHMLYPLLDTCNKQSFQACEGVKRLEGTLNQVRGEFKAMQTAVNELKELMQKESKKNFSLKEEGFEVKVHIS